ncbi:MAG TPA: FkbM family methyltransferase [Spirochaetota bacterium]
MVRNIIQRDSYKTKKYIHKNSIVIDVGANVGLFSLAASAKAKKVYAFEPNPVTFEILASHLSLWECGNCTPVQYGLGEKSDSKTILYNDEHLVWSRMEDCGMNTEPVTNSAPVEIVTLDEFASKSGVEYISFIKIDTEGYEMNVLKGAREIIKKHKPVIAISSYHKPEDITEIPAFLYSLRPDYKMMHSKRGEEDFIFA